MPSANTRRGEAAAPYRIGSDSSTGAISAFDQATLARVQQVCNFINSEIARWRNQLLAIGAASLVGMVLVPIVTRIVDPRIAVVIVGGIFWFWFVRARRELAASYVKIAIKRLVAAADKTLTYKPVSSLTREQFASLNLFPPPAKDWQSRAEIGGRVANATFALHAVNAPATQRGDMAFRGVIIRLEFSESFPGHTVVIPERRGQTPDAGAGSDATGDLVLLKNPEFERSFSAYSTDFYQARRLFTQDFTSFLIAAAETIGPDIRLALLKRSLFVAIPNVELLPDVSLFRAPVTPEEAAGELVRLAAFAGGLARAVASGTELPHIS